VVGVGMTKFGRLEESIVELACAAALEAMGDAEALETHPDRVIVGTQNPDEFTGIGHLSTLMADQLGLVPSGATRVETGPSSGASAFEAGVALVGSGLSDLVLVIGVEKMSEVDRGRASAILAKMMSNENEIRYTGCTRGSCSPQVHARLRPNQRAASTGAREGTQKWSKKSACALPERSHS